MNDEIKIAYRLFLIADQYLGAIGNQYIFTIKKENKESKGRPYFITLDALKQFPFLKVLAERKIYDNMFFI